MLKCNLEELIAEAEDIQGRRIPIKDVATESGVDRGILSRLINRPDVFPTMRALDGLAQYFFGIFNQHKDRDQSSPLHGLPEREVMRYVMDKLISVYPDGEGYWEPLPDHIKMKRLAYPVALLWELYERSKSTGARQATETATRIAEVDDATRKTRARKRGRRPVDREASTKSKDKSDKSSPVRRRSK